MFFRLFTATALTAIVGGVAGGFASVYVAADATAEGLRGMLMGLLSPRELERCRSDATSWALTFPPHSTVFAYDLQTAQSTNPSAPPLDGDLIARVRSGASYAARVRWFKERGLEVVFPTGLPGPCSLVRVFWARRFAQRMDGFGRVALVLLPMALGAVLLVSLTVRSVRRRIVRLRRAARFLGAVDEFEHLQENRDDDLTALARALNEAHERIRSSTDRFEEQENALASNVENIAHDLRAPLTALQMELERATTGGETSPSVAEALTLCIEETMYLAELTDNLWTACRLESGALSPVKDATANLGHVVETIFYRFHPLARRRSISLDIFVPDETVTGQCPPTLVQRALGNLVHNSILHGDSDGHVVVMLESIGEDEFRLSVIDDGPGVPPAALPKLGLRGFRNPRPQAAPMESAGFGLSITRSICDVCAWTLSFARVDPRGLRAEINGKRVVSPSRTSPPS